MSSRVAFGPSDGPPIEVIGSRIGGRQVVEVVDHADSVVVGVVVVRGGHRAVAGDLDEAAAAVVAIPVDRTLTVGKFGSLEYLAA